MQSAIDPDDRFAVARKLSRLLVGRDVGERKTPVGLFDLRELSMVLRRGDDRGVFSPSFGGLADLDHRHAVGLAV